MSRKEYLTAPLPSKKMPAGIPYILTTEASERFAFYGMSSILIVFMTKYLTGSSGTSNVMGDESAKAWFHWFTSAVYFMPLIGALISDVWFGKFKTIILFSVIYCVGFAVLVYDQTRLGLAGGLALIAMASGIIKPCLSANVGDQFGSSNKHLLNKVYGWFYFSVNVGACISMYLCPILLDKYGPKVGFGIPGVFMLIATVSYLFGRYKFVHIPPARKIHPQEQHDKEVIGIDWLTKHLDMIVSLLKLCIIFIFVSMFFALFYQSESAWVLQAEKMNLRWLGKDWLPAQMQAANPFLIMILIPLFSYAIYPTLNRIWTLTPLRKIGIGMFLTAGSFLVPVWIEIQLKNGSQPSIGWQFFAYIFLTAAEIMVSITAIEFAYTQAPKKMKSTIQSIELLAISLGNLFAAVVNNIIKNDDGTSKLPGASYYWFFAIAMLLTACIFIPIACWYKPKEYIQDEVSAETSA
ncbi:MAG: POT family MFS transporter [Sedimentisphaerales bacterium]|nr:POT family MFS transporter [Sedimentisphaerales bacterium]